MGGGDDWVLGVDVGTSRSAGAMANGVVTPLEVDGNRWMPSMVLLDPDGHLVVGAAADNQAGIYPDRVERTPKRHLGGTTPLLLGGQPVEVQAAIAELISVFVREGRLRRNGRAPVTTVLTHPVRWGDTRKAALAESAHQIGLDDLVLIEEPVAAAVHYVGDRVDVGECVGVYDLGGGTFDTAVLRRTPDGFETIGAPGGDEFIGGEHFDHLVFDYLGECLADDDPALWEEIQYGEDRKWTRAAADLLTQARRAKEAVSSYPSTQVVLPLVDRDVVFTRAQFEAMIRDQVQATIEEMATTITSAGLAADDLEAIYLVGGSSRIPLVTQLMTERFGSRISTRDEPKSVVALGAALVGRSRHQRDAGPTPSSPDHAAGTSSIATAGPATTTPPPGSERPILAPPPSSFRGSLAPTAPPPPPSAPLPPPPVGSDARVEPPPLVAAALRVAWQVALPSPVQSMGMGPGVVHVAVAARHVYQFDVNGQWRWSGELPSQVHLRPLTIDQAVYFATIDGHLSALALAGGQTLFRTKLSGAPTANLASWGSVIVVCDEAGTVSALDRHNGQPAWILPLADRVQAPMTAVNDKLLVATMSGRVYLVSLADGRVSWAFPAPAPVTAAPVVVDGTVFVAATNGAVYSIDIATGMASWGAQVGGAVDGAGSSAGGFFVTADRSGQITALDLSDGSVVWTSSTNGTNPTGLVASNGLLFCDTGMGQIAAISPDDGRIVGVSPHQPGSWQPPTSGPGLVLVRDGPQVRALQAQMP